MSATHGCAAAQISNPYSNYGQYTQKVPVSTINNVSQIPGESGRTISHAPAAARTGQAPLPDWLKPIASGRQDAVMERLGNLKHSERTRLECSHLYSPVEIRTADRAPFECARKYLQANGLGAHEAAVLEERFRGAERVRDVCRVLDLPVTKAHEHTWLVRNLEKSLNAYLKKANGNLDATWEGGFSCSHKQFEKMEGNLEKLLNAIGKEELRSQLITQLEPALLDRIQKLHPDCCITEIYGDLGKFVNTESVVKLGGKICDGNAMDVLREIDKILVYLDPAQPAANGGDPVPGRPSAAPLVPNQIGNQNQSSPYPPIIIHGAKAKAGHIITHGQREHSSDVERKLDKLIELIEKAPGAASAETEKVGFDQPQLRREEASTQSEALPAKVTSEMQTQTEEAQQLPPDAYPFRREELGPDATWMRPQRPIEQVLVKSSTEMEIQVEVEESVHVEDVPNQQKKEQAQITEPLLKTKRKEKVWQDELTGEEARRNLQEVFRKHAPSDPPVLKDVVTRLGMGPSKPRIYTEQTKKPGHVKRSAEVFDKGIPLKHVMRPGSSADSVLYKENPGMKKPASNLSMDHYTLPGHFRQDVHVDAVQNSERAFAWQVKPGSPEMPANASSPDDHNRVNMVAREVASKAQLKSEIGPSFFYAGLPGMRRG